jgi:hypothetical protein
MRELMNAEDLSRLQAEKESAEADVLRVRAENERLAEAFRAEPTDAARELLKRGAASLAAARDRLDAANVALQVFRKTGSPHGLVADAGKRARRGARRSARTLHARAAGTR